MEGGSWSLKGALFENLDEIGAFFGCADLLAPESDTLVHPGLSRTRVSGFFCHLVRPCHENSAKGRRGSRNVQRLPLYVSELQGG